MLMNEVIIILLKKSTNKLPTRGTTKKALGAGPYSFATVCMFAMAFGVAPIPNPQKAVVIHADS